MSQVQKCGFLWELVGIDGAAAMFRGVNHINMDQNMNSTCIAQMHSSKFSREI